MTGCVSYSGGHSGTCKYGLKQGSVGNHCYTRPKPSDKAVAKAMSGKAMARALAAWRRSHGATQVLSLGINQWAETTFATGRHDLHTFNAGGKPTSGGDGYAEHPEDPFPVSTAKPKVLARALDTIRAHQPDTKLLGAVLTVAPFSHELAWNISVINSRSTSSLAYQVLPDGSGLCHGTDHTKDALVLAPGIPPCPASILSLYSVA